MQYSDAVRLGRVEEEGSKINRIVQAPLTIYTPTTSQARPGLTSPTQLLAYPPRSDFFMALLLLGVDSMYMQDRVATVRKPV